MQVPDELLTIAELAVALAGFSGVVVAFGPQGQLVAIDRLRFAALLTLSMSAAVIAFLPSVLHLLGVADPTLWRVSSAVLLAVAISFPSVFFPRLVRAARALTALPSRSYFAAIYSLLAAHLALQLSNAVGWPYPPGAALLISGLLVWLVMAALLFGALVLSRPGYRGPSGMG